MIAVDTNILVYAHRTEAPRHHRAREWIEHLAEGDVPWGLPVFCIGEFVRVVTHRSIFDPPSSLLQATAAMESLYGSPTLRVLSPGSRFPQMLLEVLRTAKVAGNLVFDAQIATVCREHGVTTLLTEDGDFARFKGMNPMSLDAPPPG